MDLEISPAETKALKERNQEFVLLDVREAWEIETAHIEGSVDIPMVDIPNRALQELNPDDHIVVICHHGVRSMQVTHWLRKRDFENVQSMRGGIDAWAREVDTSVATY